MEVYSSDVDGIHQRLLESSDLEQSNAPILSPKQPRTIRASEEVAVLFEGELASHVSEIKPKVDILIADCEEQFGPIGMASRPSEKVCWACGYSDRDYFEESQNPCIFC